MKLFYLQFYTPLHFFFLFKSLESPRGKSIHKLPFSQWTFFAKWFDLTWAIDTLIFLLSETAQTLNNFPTVNCFFHIFFFRRCCSSKRETAKAAQRHCINLHLTFSLCNFLQHLCTPGKDDSARVKAPKGQTHWMSPKYFYGATASDGRKLLCKFGRFIDRIRVKVVLLCQNYCNFMQNKAKRAKLAHNGHETFPIYLFYSAWKGLCNNH